MTHQNLQKKGQIMKSFLLNLIIAGFSQDRRREHFLKVEDETTVQCAFEIKATTTITTITTTSTRAKQ